MEGKKSMKYITIILMLIFLTGCTKHYIIPNNLSQADFLVARAECMEEVNYPQSDWFIFGPVYIIFPVVIGYWGYKYYKSKKLNKCMEEKGYDLSN